MSQCNECVNMFDKTQVTDILVVSVPTIKINGPLNIPKKLNKRMFVTHHLMATTAFIFTASNSVALSVFAISNARYYVLKSIYYFL